MLLRIILLMLALLIVALIGLTIYAYWGDLSPIQVQIIQPILIDIK